MAAHIPPRRPAGCCQQWHSRAPTPCGGTGLWVREWGRGHLWGSGVVALVGGARRGHKDDTTGIQMGCGEDVEGMQQGCGGHTTGTQQGCGWDVMETLQEHGGYTTRTWLGHNRDTAGKGHSRDVAGTQQGRKQGQNQGYKQGHSRGTAELQQRRDRDMAGPEQSHIRDITGTPTHSTAF